jgi:hypothetical protein
MAPEDIGQWAIGARRYCSVLLTAERGQVGSALEAGGQVIFQAAVGGEWPRMRRICGQVSNIWWLSVRCKPTTWQLLRGFTTTSGVKRRLLYFQTARVEH